MNDAFASSKHHSLFPMAIPCPNISKEDYHIFYRNERRLFALLIVVLRREIAQSILVLGFLLWLEREGYTSKNLVQTILSCLSTGIIDLFIDDVVICLKCIQKKENKLPLEGSSSKGLKILSLNKILDRKRMCLLELHENRDRIFAEVSTIANDVCAKAFEDILQQFAKHGSTSPVITGVGVEDSRYLGPNVPSTYDVYNYLRFHRNAGLTTHQFWSMVPFGKTNCATHNPLEQEPEVSPDDRTIFLTFSKGYPISESEIKDYFTSYFGDFIEEIHMADVEPDKQPLYARIVAFSRSMVEIVVERDSRGGKSKYNINGKHVWARKYVKKKPVRVPSTVPAIAPPKP